MSARAPNILILSFPEDIHFQAVHWALTRAGIDTVLLQGHDFPRARSESFRIASDGPAHLFHLRDGENVDATHVQIVWNRRAQRPAVSKSIPKQDRGAALTEAEQLVEGVGGWLAEQVRWVNDPFAERRAAKKPYQLAAAHRCGLRVPDTLISNNLEEIRRFFAHHSNNVIFKTLRPMTWHTDTEHYILYGEKVTFAQVTGNPFLSETPHFFQRYIDKDFEVRAIILGDRIHSFSLNSQASEDSKTDWRRSQDGSLTPEPIVLPEPVETAILLLMRGLGLEYGAVDLICDTAGDFWFLEVNPAGQFLFLEAWNPETRLLAAFCEFLTCRIELQESQRHAIAQTRFDKFTEDASARAYYKKLVMRHTNTLDPTFRYADTA